MKKILALSICTVFALSLAAQETPEKTPKTKPTFNMANRANDHFLVQLCVFGTQAFDHRVVFLAVGAEDGKRATFFGHVD